MVVREKMPEEPKEAFKLELCPCCEKLADNQGHIACGCEGFGCFQSKVVILVSPDPDYIPSDREGELTGVLNCWKIVHRDCGKVLGRFEWPLPPAPLSGPYPSYISDATWC